VPSSPLPGISACATFAERVVGTLWWHARFPEHTLDLVPRFRPGRGARQAFFGEEEDGTCSITLPRHYRTKGIVLHELVHWALSDEQSLPYHGLTFTRLLLDATAEFCGSDRASVLADSFVTHRVKVGALPKTASDGRLLYGWDERSPQ
jgi:hypothetical protein